MVNDPPHLCTVLSMAQVESDAKQDKDLLLRALELIKEFEIDVVYGKEQYLEHKIAPELQNLIRELRAKYGTRTDLPRHKDEQMAYQAVIGFQDELKSFIEECLESLHRDIGWYHDDQQHIWSAHPDIETVYWHYRLAAYSMRLVFDSQFPMMEK